MVESSYVPIVSVDLSIGPLIVVERPSTASNASSRLSLYLSLGLGRSF